MENINNNQPEIIIISSNLRLRTPKSDEWYLGVKWYSNEKVMFYSEGVSNRFYTLEEVTKMYSFLSKTGELYFIEILEENN